MSWVAENKHKYRSNIYDPMIFEVSDINNLKTSVINRRGNECKYFFWSFHSYLIYKNKYKIVYSLNTFNFLLQLSISSEEAAMYLENVVRQRDLYAFVCEDKNDMSDLINELCVKQKLSVNVLYCAPADRCLYTSTVPLSEIT